MTARPHSSAFSLLRDFGRVTPDVEEPDHEAQLKAAFEDGHRQGYADGRAEAEADAEHRLAEAKIHHANELAQEKDRWQRDFAEQLVARLESASGLIEKNIAERVATLLRPWLIGRLQDRALQDLERAILRGLVEGAKIHIEGPAEIIQHLNERLPTAGFQIGYSESPSADVRAHIENTEIEVNIAAWIAELEALVP